MPDQPEPQPTTLPGAAQALGRALIGALPPAFIMLVLINSAFLGIVLWFLNFQIDQRTHLVEKIIDHCYELEAHK